MKTTKADEANSLIPQRTKNAPLIDLLNST